MDLFFDNLLSCDIEGADIQIVDNSVTEDFSIELSEKIGRNVHHINVSRYDPSTQFLRNVTESVSYLREMFLKTDKKYFVIVESDVLPPKNFLDLFMEVIDDADIIGGVYYAGIHRQELFENDIFEETPHVLSGCTLYKREVIEKIPFRWGTDNLGAFPDAWICYDTGRKGNNFRLANYSKIKCGHYHKIDGSRGHENIT